MATTHRSDLVDGLEKALRDEAYDGGFGYMGDEQFTAYVRGLAVTAAKVVEEAHTPADDEREVLRIAELDARQAAMQQDRIDWFPDYETEPAVAHDSFVRGWDAAVAARFRRAEVPEPSAEPNPITLEDLSETSTSLKDLVDEARSEAAWCCDNGCGSGACETCPCCSAGYCVSGFDGVPDDPEDREHWLEVAAEYNPVAAALRAAGGAR
ncbi:MULTISPECIES: hypothetical protein [Microbacterium]|uniref:hypothetical protein n=1 Tax=Microbacterium TaxID=33882 RepID=UPI0026F1FD2A|nr:MULTISPECIES: hypothetical protein [Microbacterium]